MLQFDTCVDCATHDDSADVPELQETASWKLLLCSAGARGSFEEWHHTCGAVEHSAERYLVRVQLDGQLPISFADVTFRALPRNA